MIVLEGDYAVFFKEVKDLSSSRVNESIYEDISKYCHEENKSNVYDGNFKYTCFFEGLKIEEAYKKLRVINNFSLIHMIEILPKKNEAFEIKGSVVSYSWDKAGGLRIFITTDSEEMNYFFSEGVSGTNLEITGSAKY